MSDCFVLVPTKNLLAIHDDLFLHYPEAADSEVSVCEFAFNRSGK